MTPYKEVLLREKTNCSMTSTSAGSVKDQKSFPPKRLKGNIRRYMEQCGTMQSKETPCFQKESTVLLLATVSLKSKQSVGWQRNCPYK